MRRTLLVTLLGVASAAAPPPPIAPPGQEPATYALVVNANNPFKGTAEAARKNVKLLYLKDLTRWTDGVEARPYARSGGSVEQAAFLTDVLGMSEAELARHWLRLKNMNGTAPPKEVDTDRLLLKHVARHDGAFGVVAAKNANAEGVRVLFEFKQSR